MAATISLVQASHPEGVTAAAGRMQGSVSALDGQIASQQQSLAQLARSWQGAAADAALRRGQKDLHRQRTLRSRLQTMQSTLNSGGSQLSALRTQILSTAAQARSLGGLVSDDGTVRVSGVGQLMTPRVAGAFTAVLRALLKWFAAVDHSTAAALTAASRPSTPLPGAGDDRMLNFGIGDGPPLAPPPEDPEPESKRRQNQIDAFKEVFGRVPTSATDWQTAAALDPHSYSVKNEGVPPTIVVGRIKPVPGQGIVRTGLFIPRDEVFNIPSNDLGDNRGFDPSFGPENSRVGLFIDYENGLVITRQNPSVDVDGNVMTSMPDVRVQQAPDGAVRIQYAAKNAFAPPGADLSGHVVNGDIVVTPGVNGGAGRVDGTISDYPSLEVYQNLPNGSTVTLAQDAADSGGPYGPLGNLPFSHDIGRGAAAIELFQSHAPQLPGGPRFPGDTVPYVPGAVDPNTPTELGPVGNVPNVVVVR